MDCSNYFCVIQFLIAALCILQEGADAAFSTTDSTIPSPAGLDYYPFQIRNIEQMVKSNRILLCDEMGLGKTITAIGAINALFVEEKRRRKENNGSNNFTDKKKKPSQFNPKVLIVAPKSVLSVWEQELKDWLVAEKDDDHKNGHDDDDNDNDTEHRSITIGVATAKKFPSHSTNIILINYDIVHKFREELDYLGPFDVMVCDEAHYMKSSNSRRTEATIGGGGRYHRRTPGIECKRLWLLTGSPLLNNPIEFFPLLRAVDPTFEIIPELKSLTRFRDRYCGRQQNEWGVTYKGGKNLEELRSRLRKKRGERFGGTPLMLRKTKQEILVDLPEKRYQLLPLNDHNGAAAAQEIDVLMQTMQQQQDHKNDDNFSNSEASNFPPPSQEQLEKSKVVELRSMLEERCLPRYGRKKVLIQRILDYDAKAIMEDNFSPRPAPLVKDDNVLSNNHGLHKNVQAVLRSAPNDSRSSYIYRLIGWTKGDGNAIMSALSKARHQTALLKVPSAIKYLESCLISRKVVVFAHHRDVQEEIYNAFADDTGRDESNNNSNESSFTAVEYHGSMSQEERADAVLRFQTDPSVRLFVGSIRAAGLGVTLTAANHVVFVEMDWSPMVNQQAEDRCHRIGQKSKVLVQYLFFRNTIDEHLSQVLASKQSTVSAAIDEPVGLNNWKFDFGKYKGVSIGDVSGSNPGYLRWLVKNDVHKTRSPILSNALINLGYIKVNPQVTNSNKEEKEQIEIDIDNNILPPVVVTSIKIADEVKKEEGKKNVISTAEAQVNNGNKEKKEQIDINEDNNIVPPVVATSIKVADEGKKEERTKNAILTADAQVNNSNKEKKEQIEIDEDNNIIPPVVATSIKVADEGKKEERTKNVISTAEAQVDNGSKEKKQKTEIDKGNNILPPVVATSTKVADEGKKEERTKNAILTADAQVNNSNKEKKEQIEIDDDNNIVPPVVATSTKVADEGKKEEGKKNVILTAEAQVNNSNEEEKDQIEMDKDNNIGPPVVATSTKVADEGKKEERTKNAILTAEAQVNNSNEEKKDQIEMDKEDDILQTRVATSTKVADEVRKKEIKKNDTPKKSNKKKCSKATNEDPGIVMLQFGKHKGETIRDVPNSYLTWLTTSKAVNQQRGLLKLIQSYLESENVS